MKRLLVSCLLALMLVACGEKKEVKDTVFGPMIQTKEKARAVEEKLRQGAEKNREALTASEQEGGTEQKRQ